MSGQGNHLSRYGGTGTDTGTGGSGGSGGSGGRGGGSGNGSGGRGLSMETRRG